MVRGVSASAFVDARVRRQIVRWFIHDQSIGGSPPPPLMNESVIHALRTALEDEDWEVQVTAMLAAGRLRAEQLRSAIDHLHLPSSGATGLDRADCNALAAARYVVVTYLNGTLTESNVDDALTRMPGVPSQFARCIMGLPIDHMDSACLLVTSLTTPVPQVHDAPDMLPVGIVRSDTRLMLGTTDIEMVWIPPVPHWLGETDHKTSVSNPIRQITPERGYFIAKRSLLAHQAQTIAGTSVTTTPSNIALGSYSDAVQWCRILSHHTGASVSLPTADQWEMAARGPDGRRYPWGNNIERAAWLRDPQRIRTVMSPWGLCDTVGVVAQWTLENTNTPPLLCGAPGTLRVAARQPAVAGAMYAVRPMVT